MSLCQYKDSLGKPNMGVHSYRFAGVAIVDVVLTFALAWVIAYFMKQSFLKVVFIVFLVGVLCHRVFCVQTTLDKLFFIE